MKILSDTHIHSDNSFDAESSVRDLCLSAIEKDISVIAVTDHMEAPEIKLGDRSVFGNMIKQISKSVEDAETAAKEFDGKLKVLRGMELGEPLHEPKLTKKALAIADFDFILASIHNIKNTEDFYYLEYNEKNIPELLKRYFDELLETAQNADFDSLAHLTYPLRYIIERTDIRPDLDEYCEVIDNIFKALIKR
ncbi:MAG: PHP domain-containing protein, partial [Ruminococcus sp.]|nr:PHP domain-containing protein [Ruminococcus sp.]